MFIQQHASLPRVYSAALVFNPCGNKSKPAAPLESGGVFFKLSARPDEAFCRQIRVQSVNNVSRLRMLT